MEADTIEEGDLFSAVSRSSARALLIGRRALVAIGLPLLTADYDFWLAADDVEAFNAALQPLGLHPNRTPAQARSTGRYVLENGERVDVLLAREVRTTTGDTVSFEPVWARREEAELGPGIRVALPCLDDLIATKRFTNRPKDIEDLRLLEILRRERSQP